MIDRELPATTELRFMEIGTGSGAISCLLSKRYQDSIRGGKFENIRRFSGIGYELSKSATQLTEENLCRTLGYYDQRLYQVIHGDFLKLDLEFEENNRQKFHLIVSNPPYIDPAEMQKLDIQVTKFEPHESLFSGNMGYFHTMEYLRKARNLLIPGGYVVLELEPEKIQNFEEKARELYDTQEFTFNSDWKVVEKKEDIFGLLRFIALKKN